MGTLTLLVTNHRPFYRSGDVISGVVTYSVKKREDVETITISLAGASESMVMGESRTSDNDTIKEYHRENIVLFQLDSILFYGPYTLGTQTFQFPFEFVFPHKTQHVRTLGAGDAHFESQPHPLPPSISSKKPSFSVTYSLKATVKPGNIFSRSSETVEVKVAQQDQSTTPLLDLTQPWPRTFSYTHTLARPYPLRLRQKLKASWTSDPLLAKPKLNLKVSLHIPKAVSIHDSFPISLSLEHVLDAASINDPVAPTIIFEEAFVELDTHSSVRVTPYKHRYNYKTTFYDDTSQILAKASVKPSSEAVKSSKAMMQIPLDDTSIVLTPNFRLADMCWLEPAIPSAFSSYTVNRRSRLRMQCNLRHVESGERIELEKIAVALTIAPARQEPEQGMGKSPFTIS